MAYMTINEYRRQYFAPGSAPSVITVKRRIRAGHIYGKKQGGTWYVDPSIKTIPNASSDLHQIPNKIHKSTNPGVLAVLAKRAAAGKN